jgi:chromosome segregation ATPase
MALQEYQELKGRHDFLTGQQTDLQQALDSLKKAINQDQSYNDETIPGDLPSRQ